MHDRVVPRGMRIVLKKQAGGSYFVDHDTWTTDPEHARSFPTTWDALQFCKEHGLPATTVVMKAKDSRYDVSVAEC